MDFNLKLMNLTIQVRPWTDNKIYTDTIQDKSFPKSWNIVADSVDL